MSALFQPVKTQVFKDMSLAPGAVIYFYEAGTSTPKAVYADPDLDTALGTSVTADANGAVPGVYLDISGGGYKYRIESDTGGLIDEEDGFFGVGLFGAAPSKVGSVAEGIPGLIRVAGQHVIATGWHEGSQIGGGDFVYVGDRGKSDHNGGTVISPTVPPVSEQPGATLNDRRDAFLAGTGETDPSGSGVFVRLDVNPVNVPVDWFGGTTDGTDQTKPALAALAIGNPSFRDGTHLISESLLHDALDEKGRFLIGESQGGTVLKATAAIHLCSIQRTTGNFEFVKANGLARLTFDGNGLATSGLRLYSAWYNLLGNVTIKGCVDGIQFDGDNSENPDATASVFTELRFCEIVENEVGVNNLYNNNSPLLYSLNTRILNNTKAGVIWNSSYFRMVGGSLSFNGSDTGAALGGFVNIQRGTYADYVSKGLILSGVEMDSNYPRQWQFDTANYPVVENCSLQLATNYFTIPGFSKGFIGKVGGTAANQRTRGLVLRNNRYSLNNLDGSSYSVDSAYIHLAEGALYTKEEGSTWVASDAHTGAGTDYFYIVEDSRAGSVNHSGFDDQETYAEVDKQAGIPDNRKISGFSLVYQNEYDPRYINNDRAFYIADDDFIVIDINEPKRANDLGAYIGTATVTTNNPTNFSAIVAYRAQGSPQTVGMFTGTLTSTTIGALTGTTGADGELTISAADDNKLYIENRTGAALYLVAYLDNNLKLVDE